MRLLPTAALILGVAGLPSATAHAATTIGSTATTGTVGFAVPGTVVQASDGPFGPSYAAPSAGVIVSYTASAAWTPGSLSPTVALKVVRPLGGANYRVVGASRVSPVANGAGRDRVGFGRPHSRAGGRPSRRRPRRQRQVRRRGGGSPGQLGAFAGDPGPGSDFSTSAAGAYNLLVSARLEPDVDGDGYGDESQDACPTVSTRHLIPCLTPPPPPPPPPGGSTGSDLAAGLSVRPARVRPGQTVVVTATATSRSGTSSAAHVRLALPAALKLVSALGSSGRCVGLVCPVGALPPVAAGRALYTVKASRAGRYTLKARASHANQDLAPGNDAASAKLSVVAPVRCVVPKLTGLTLAKAKRRLAKAHCRLGKVTGPRTGRITVQTRRPKAKRFRGAKIGVRLVVRRARA